MVIKASAAAEIRQLIEALAGSDEVRRETAVARLSVIGPRAVDRLIAAYGTATTRELKVAVLRALDVARDPRAVAVAREAIADGGDVALAGVAVLATLLDGDTASVRAGVLEILVATSLDKTAARRVRLASFQAIEHLPKIGQQMAAALQSDPDEALSAGAHAAPGERAAADAVWQDALEGRLPDNPALLRDVARTRAPVAPLGALQKMIELVRVREGSIGAGPRRDEWRGARGALHQTLALRGSRVAVYDLRETIEEARGPLPVSFLAALHVVGDESCVESLAGAYARTPADEARWRHQLGAAFRAIARREKITRRHAAFKRVAARWPDAARELST
ncbi:MAG: hypothetical protein M3545_03880 [Acidobacteriota bacterium]|nr:hypothetical protein [Acidobacteriota bacterium]